MPPGPAPVGAAVGRLVFRSLGALCVGAAVALSVGKAVGFLDLRSRGALFVGAAVASSIGAGVGRLLLLGPRAVGALV